MISYIVLLYVIGAFDDIRISPDKAKLMFKISGTLDVMLVLVGAYFLFK